MDRRKILIVLGLVLWLAVGVVAFSAWRLAEARPPAFHGTTYEEILPAADFRLIDHTGRPATLQSFRGSPVLLFFGYTHCPDVCPLTLTRLKTALDELGGRAKDVRVVLVTVDPARDTPEVLADYVRRFGPQVTGLTGDSASVARAMAGYGAYILPTADASPASPAASAEHDGHGEHASSTDAAKNAVVSHSGVVYGIDRQGNLRVVISERAPLEKVKDDARTLARL